METDHTAPPPIISANILGGSPPTSQSSTPQLVNGGSTKPARQTTRKNKIHNSAATKKQLWKSFSETISDISTSTNVQNCQMNCIYTDGNTSKDNCCHLCGESMKTTPYGFLGCSSRTCGVLDTSVVEHGAEWRYYGAESGGSDPSRCGMPIDPILRESSFGCGVACKGGSSYQMRKIRRYTEWQSVPYKEKALYDDFVRISNLSKQSGISQIIIDSAKHYYAMLSEHTSFRGLNRDGIISASIYISCRTNNVPRTPKEIATIFKLDTTSATKGCKNALTILNDLEKGVDREHRSNLTTTTSLDFIDRYCSRLEIGMELSKVCRFVSNLVEKNRLVPENIPHAIAAGIIYYVGVRCGLKISKRAVSEISGISEVTVNKCYKKLDECDAKLIPSAVLRRYGGAPQSAPQPPP